MRFSLSVPGLDNFFVHFLEDKTGGWTAIVGASLGVPWTAFQKYSKLQIHDDLEKSSLLSKNTNQRDESPCLECANAPTVQ